MEIAELIPIVSQWVASGLLSEFNKELLKSDYAKSFGLPGNCNSCYWNDVQIYYRLLIRKASMKKVNSKYIVNPTFGAIRVFGSMKMIVTSGIETFNTEPLTDELAERLLAESEGYAEMISPNPDYVEPVVEVAPPLPVTPKK